MPSQRRFRRLGSTSAAASLGALTLVVTGAGPAGAGTTKVSAPGNDPITALQRVPCRLQNITGEVTVDIGGRTDDVTDDLTGDGRDPQPAGPPEKTTRPRPAPRAAAPPEHADRGGVPFTVHGVRAIGLPHLNGELPVPPASEADLSRLLPQPRVAAAPPPPVAQPAPVGRLVTPVAATDRQHAQMLWVAVASGLAGAVGALNLSVAGRRLRRPKA